jgi:acyl dehydratase
LADDAGDNKLSFEERLQTFVGQEAERPLTGRDPVNAAFIRAWCDAIGDQNPIYTDPDFAHKSVHGGIVAPPTMIQAWFFPAVGTPRPEPGTRIAELIAILRAAGFVSVVATNFEHEYIRYVRPGDVLTLRQLIGSISAEKQTALGSGHFVNTVGSVCDQSGAPVCSINYRRIFFRPKAKAQK